MTDTPAFLYDQASESVTKILEPREAVANLMILHGYATGHGDTLDDLLTELVAHVSAAVQRS